MTKNPFQTRRQKIPLYKSGHCQQKRAGGSGTKPPALPYTPLHRSGRTSALPYPVQRFNHLLRNDKDTFQK